MAKITQINNGDETYEIEDARAVHKDADNTVGALVFRDGYAIKRNDSSHALQVHGGSDADASGKSGRLVLYGKDNTDNPSAVQLYGDNFDKARISILGSTEKSVPHQVVIKAENGVEINHALTVGGAVVVGDAITKNGSATINGNATINGSAVEIKTNNGYPIRRTDDTHGLVLTGGTDTDGNGTSGRITLFGSDHNNSDSDTTGSKGCVLISAGDNTAKIMVTSNNANLTSGLPKQTVKITGAVQGTGVADAILPGANPEDSEDVDLSGVTAEFTILVKYDSWICFEGNVDVADTEAKLTLAGTLKQVARSKAANAFLAVSIPARANESVAVTYANMKTDGSLKLKIHPMSAVTDVSKPYYTVTNGAVQTQTQE